MIELELYIFWFLHQTTTSTSTASATRQLYIFWFLHQTTTYNRIFYNSGQLYIFWFLHQTTTVAVKFCSTFCCISFDSYIKPQPGKRRRRLARSCISFDSYIKPQRIGLYNFTAIRCISFDSYIKPQLAGCLLHVSAGCISFDSYIKPQPMVARRAALRVVYLLIPTSNHNLQARAVDDVLVVYLLIPTSNHNHRVFDWFTHMLYIFWFLHQTTTGLECLTEARELYIFWFLHQTTTDKSQLPTTIRCISFDSYIKPQPMVVNRLHRLVVYLLIPTSNHNWRR